jgi:hypothetical protein
MDKTKYCGGLFLNRIAKALLALFTLFLAVSTPSYADLTLAGPEFDFGFVPSNSTLVYRTWLHNGGDDSVRVADIKAGCGCITAPLETWIIPPGDSLQLTFYWRTRVIEGPETKPVYVYVIGREDPLRLKLTGSGLPAEVETMDIEWSPRTVDFGQGVKGDSRERSLRLRNRTDQAASVAVVSAPDKRLELSLPETLPAGGEAVGRISLIAAAAKVAFEDSFTLELTTEAGYIYRLSVPIVNGDFSFRPVLTKSEE